MDFLLVSKTRLLLLAVFGLSLAQVFVFGEESSEFTFLLQAGKSDCFFQRAIQNGTMEVEYQVIVYVPHKRNAPYLIIAY